MLSLVFTLLVACEQKPPPIPGELERTGAVLATVNGVNVTQGMMDATLGGLPPNIREKVKAQGQEAQFKEKLVIGELLYQEALKQKLYEKPEIKTQLALAQRDAMAQAIMDKVINERTTDEALKKWYDEHKVQFARPQAKARHVLVKDKAEADAIFAQVKADNGATFAQIAAAKSTDPGSAKEGGSLGWFEKGRMVPEFAEAVFAGNKGDIVGPIQTKFGFHVIQIEDKRDEIPLDEAKDKIKEKLRSEVIEAYIEELKKAATITDAAAGGAAVAPAAETDKKPGAAPAAPPAGAPPAPATGK